MQALVLERCALRVLREDMDNLSWIAIALSRRVGPATWSRPKKLRAAADALRVPAARTEGREAFAVILLLGDPRPDSAIERVQETLLKGPRVPTRT